MKIGDRVVKTGLGTALAMIIAQLLKLKFYPSAGVITILSIQNTKRKSLKVASQRVMACFIGLTIAGVLFEFIGFNAVVFGLFMIIFIPIAVKFKISEGIVMSSVLATHFLTEGKITTNLVLNEIGLIIIGVGVALLLNLYMPDISNSIKNDQKYIEERMRKIFLEMAESLQKLSVSLKEDILFKDLENKLYETRKKAYINLNNYFTVDESYYVKYMEMRINQFECMKRMREHFQRFFMTYEQTEMIAKLTQKIGENLHEDNPCDALLEDLTNLREELKESELPTTREEFENRAMLYQFLNDMEEFLVIKRDFYKINI